MSRGSKVGITAIFGLGVLYVTRTCFSFFSFVLKSALSCIVSSIVRLVYTVGFMKANLEGDYASYSLTLIVSLYTINSAY